MNYKEARALAEVECAGMFRSLDKFFIQGIPVPRELHEEIARYVAYGEMPREQLIISVLSNDLMGAVKRSKELGIYSIDVISEFFCKEVTSGAYGSPERVALWVESKSKELAPPPVSVLAQELKDLSYTWDKSRARDEFAQLLNLAVQHIPGEVMYEYFGDLEVPGEGE